MCNTGTITVTWEEEGGALEFDISDNVTMPILLHASASLYTASLKELRKLLGDRWAGNAWRVLKELVENEVFVYTVTPLRTRGREEQQR